eukprot:375496_1
MQQEDIFPHKALNHTPSMITFLQNRIHDAKNMIELVPFMDCIMDLAEFKKQLSNLLIQQKDDKIRSLFISLNNLNGIPCDIIQAKIFSYLPASEYKKLPIVSKNFRNIMQNHPFIWNEKRY